MVKEISARKQMKREKDVGQQILELLALTFGIVLLLVEILFSIGEAIYRLFKPAEPKVIREDIVLVTGAGHGIGRELALAYAAEGCTVVCWDINAENNEMTAKDIMKNGGPKPYAYVCNVASRAEVLATARKVKEDIGDVTILINNAGIMIANNFESQSPEDIKRTMDINIMAHFWTIEAFLPAMKKFNHGHIVALSSIAAVVATPYLMPYCASKYAVRGLMESLTEELRLNRDNKIKTTCIFPYLVDTGLCKHPIVKHESFMSLLDPKFVAKEIMKAQRNNVVETTIPSYMMKLNYFARLFPYKAIVKVRDFFGGGVLPEI